MTAISTDHVSVFRARLMKEIPLLRPDFPRLMADPEALDMRLFEIWKAVAHTFLVDHNLEKVALVFDTGDDTCKKKIFSKSAVSYEWFYTLVSISIRKHAGDMRH